MSYPAHDKQNPGGSWYSTARSIARPDVLLSSVLVNLLALGLPMLTLQVYDRIIPNNAQETFAYLVSGLLVVLVLDVILKLSRASITGFMGARFEHHASASAFERLLNSRLEDVEGIPAGTHLDRISGIDTVRDFYSGPAALTFVDLPFALLFLGLIAFIAGPLVIAPIMVLIVAVVLAIWLGNGLKAAIGDRKVWDDRRYNFIIETLGGIHTIKGLAMEPLMQRRYERLLKSSSETSHRVALLSGLSQSISSLFGQIALVAVTATGSLMVIEGTLSIGGLAACALLGGRTVQPILRALSSWTRFQSISVAEQKMSEINALPLESIGGQKTETIDKLELVAAEYRYKPDLPVVIKGASISVEVGEMIGIQGENGAGKSTFLNLLTGRLIPTSGQFLINDTEALDFDPRHVRDQVAYLSQRPVMMQGTVLDNLTFFRPDLYMEPALDFAARLGLDEVFARMPEGYDTMVGDTASNSMPRGVSQRIAIIRALARGPRFLLFDEANSSLDGQGEALLKTTLDTVRKDVGIIMVTYRPSLLRLADRQYTLADGILAPKAISLPPDGAKGGAHG